MYRSFTSAAALLAFLPSTLAAGTAYVVSNCGFDVYYASVSQNVGAAMKKLPAGGYSESYSKPNDGISIKISTSMNGPVTQFEFTWDSPNINYDISHINGNPFEAYGESLVPSQPGAAGYPSCVALNCPAGTSFCNDAYNLPDDIQTRVCPDSSDLTLTLCPGGSSNVAPSISSAKGSAAASTAVVVSSVASHPGFSAPVPAASSQPAFSFSQTAFSRTAAAPSAPQASTPAAIPTSFQTFTTPAGGRPVASSFQAQASTSVSIVTNPIQNSQVAAPSTPVASAPASVVTNPVQNSEVAAPTTPAAQATTPAASHAWSWGNWGEWHHQHTRRAHSHHFRL